MKRFFLLTVVLALLVGLARLTYGSWSRWLMILKDSDTSNLVQGLDAALGILTSILVGLGFFLRLGAKPRSPEPMHPRQGVPETEHLQKGAYEPTPLLDTAPSLDKDASPYLGLSAFQREDAHLFFGRRREIREALAWLGARPPGDSGAGAGRYRWLQIEGNSGAGKSSLVNAGLLPLVEQGKLAAQTGFGHWRIIGPMMPGEQPLRRLAEVLEQALVEDPDKRDTLACQQRL